ncbi:MAG: metallophosphoesterase [Acidobacteria bacterium]|nr:metallophosphoesterase [Acidobacteriota bacterium]
MAQTPLGIVTPQDIARSVTAQKGELQETVRQQANRLTKDPLRQARLNKAFQEIAGELQRHDNGDAVLSTSQHPMASVLQSFVQQKAAESGKIETTDEGPIVRFSDADLLEWIKTGFLIVFDSQDKFQWHTAPDDPDPWLKQDTTHLRIAAFGDWATGRYGAPLIADSIRNDPDGFDMVLHLGDVYYSGQPGEVQDLLIDAFPYRNDSLHRALNGNHEMYSGGKPYRDAIASGRFQQRETHFFVQNKWWTIVGLDTAYKDHDLMDEEVDWLKRILQQAGDRKIVLFSHHQPFSLLDSQGPKLVNKLKDILEARRILAWYWGHEHRCVLYDKHPKWGLFGRCIGHGGFPYFRDQLGPTVDKLTFKKVGPDKENGVPGARILDGPNQHIPGAPKLYGPHGYASLVFDEHQLREFMHRPDGVTIETKLLTA